MDLESSSEDEFFDADEYLTENKLIEASDGNSNDKECVKEISKCKLVNALNLKELLEGQEFEFELENKGVLDEQEDVLGDFETSDPNNITNRETLKNDIPDPNLDVKASIFRKDPKLMTPLFHEGNMHPITDCGGIIKKVLECGRLGSEVKDGEIVCIHYSILMEGIKDPIDNTWVRKWPIEFRIGSGSVISVLDIAVRTMNIKEKSVFIASPKFAYGVLGSPPRIPPDSKATVIIKLLHKINERKKIVAKMKSFQRVILPFQEVREIAEHYKTQGNKLYGISKYLKAVQKYSTAINIAKDLQPNGPNEQTEKMELLNNLYSNKAQACIMLEDFNLAIQMCKLAIELPLLALGKKKKVYFRYGKALMLNGSPSEAKELFDQAGPNLMNMNDSDVLQLYKQIQTQIEEEKVMQKIFAQKVFT